LLVVVPSISRLEVRAHSCFPDPPPPGWL